MKEITQKLVTAGNKITCARCTAKSKRSGEQCKKPALKASRTQKCEFHGGRSTGPKTKVGRDRQRAAVINTGNCNDPPDSAHFKPLVRMPQRVFSSLGLMRTPVVIKANPVSNHAASVL
jgi:hypothetical protein